MGSSNFLTALVPSAASAYAELLTALTYFLMARSGSLITNSVDHRKAGERFNFRSIWRVLIRISQEIENSRGGQAKQPMSPLELQNQGFQYSLLAMVVNRF